MSEREFRGLIVTHTPQDVIDDLHRVLKHHGYGIVEGDWRGEKIMVLVKMERGVPVPMGRIGQILPGQVLYWSATDALPALHPTTQRTQ